MILPALMLMTLGFAAEPTPAAQIPSAASVQAPALYVVKMHADWCPGCRILGDLRETVAPHVEGLPVRFVTLDLTDRRSTERALVKARVMGLEEVWLRNQGRTGVVLLIEPGQDEVAEMFTARDSAEKIAEAIRARVAKN